jgi:integrase
MKAIAKNIYQHQDNKFKATVIVKKNGIKRKKTFTASSKVKSVIIKEAQKYIKELKESFEPKRYEANTLNDLFDIYIKQETRYREDKTNRYNKFLKPTLGSMNIKDIKKYHVEDIFTKLLKQGYKTSTAVKNTKTLLSAILSFAVSRDILQSNPIYGLKLKTESTLKRVNDPLKEFNAVEDAINDLFADKPLHKAIMITALYTARRRSEIQNLKWSDINFQSKTYTLRETKNGETPTFAMHVKAIEAIKALPKITDYVFTNPDTREPYKDYRYLTDKIKQATGIKRYSMHYNRNLIASYLYAKGIHPNDISSFLGHTDFSTVLRYLSINTEQASSRIVGAF